MDICYIGRLAALLQSSDHQRQPWQDVRMSLLRLTAATSPFLNNGLPRTVDAALHALVSGTFLGMSLQCPFRFLSTAMWDLEAISQPNLRDP
jgi:hypothetical protein